MSMRIRCYWPILIALACSMPSSASIVFEDYHFYGTDDQMAPGLEARRTIYQYGPYGDFRGTLVLPSSLTSEIRGCAFGPDGLLYVVSVANFGFKVFALDAAGTVHRQYGYSSNYIGGSGTYGKINFDSSGNFYVGGLAGLVRFDADDVSSGTIIYPTSGNGIADMKPLPNGNILAINDNELFEITSSGSFVRSYNPGPGHPWSTLWGIEYDAAKNEIFVAELDGGSADYIMKLDGTTGQYISSTTFTYAHDLVLAQNNGWLVATSWTLRPGVFTEDLGFVGQFGTVARPFFMTQLPEPASIMGLVVLILFSRKPSQRLKAPQAGLSGDVSGLRNRVTH